MTSGLKNARVVIDPPITDRLWDENLQRVTPKWMQWVMGITGQVNRTSPRAPVTLAPTTGAFIWTSNIAGDSRVLVSGGTVSAIALSRDGVIYYATGVVAGVIPMSQGDFIKITNTVVPTVVVIPA
jgi:hypothetical protein